MPREVITVRAYRHAYNTATHADTRAHVKIRPHTYAQYVY